ncbi:MAG TPA: Hsp20/alpha crystallin family protein [Planctomycetota bacterium]|nr:Hsp20/alpha crystallin family protein [Planctomycetota bacterium]
MDNTALQNREAETMPQQAPRRMFMPRADVYETPDAIVVVADLPGVDENHIDITLENDVLTIHGRVEPLAPAGHKLAYAEYGEGDYHREFQISNEIDRDAIQAAVKNGVLKLTLPKAGPAKTRKITVKSE